MESQTQRTVLDEVLGPLVHECFTPEAARQVAEYKADEKVERRLDELSVKCTEGSLSEDEQAEYEDFVQAIDLISIIPAKARALLDNTSGA